MVYVKWACLKCEDVKVSNSKRHHQMDICKCGGSGLDLEEEYSRMMGNFQSLEKYNYNFFDELVLCMKEQDFLEFVDIGDKKRYLNLTDVYDIRKIEDEICESLI